MKNKLTIIALALSAVAFGACANYDETPAAKGAFSLDVRMGESATKAAMSQDELLSSAKVSIYKADFTGKVREYVYSQMPQTIYLRTTVSMSWPVRSPKRTLPPPHGSRRVTRVPQT